MKNNDMKTVVLSGVELHWSKLSPEGPVDPFNTGIPRWETQVQTSSNAIADSWKKDGLNVKKKDGVFFSNLKRKSQWPSGDPMKPVVVVDHQLMPFEDVSRIGNGTVANVQVTTRPYDVAGNKGISVEIKAIQVINLKEYTGSSGLAFEAIDIAEAASDADELWD